MISVVAQERLLGAALGSTLTGVVVFEQRRRIHKSISDFQSQFSPKSKISEPVISKKPRLELGHLWNKAVDQTLGSLIKSLSSRGCLKRWPLHVGHSAKVETAADEYENQCCPFVVVAEFLNYVGD